MRITWPDELSLCNCGQFGYETCYLSDISCSFAHKKYGEVFVAKQATFTAPVEHEGLRTTLQAV